MKKITREPAPVTERRPGRCGAVRVGSTDPNAGHPCILLAGHADEHRSVGGAAWDAPQAATDERFPQDCPTCGCPMSAEYARTSGQCSNCTNVERVTERDEKSGRLVYALLPFTLCRTCGHGFRPGSFTHPDCSDTCRCPFISPKGY